MDYSNPLSTLQSSDRSVPGASGKRPDSNAANYGTDSCPRLPGLSRSWLTGGAAPQIRAYGGQQSHGPSALQGGPESLARRSPGSELMGPKCLVPSRRAVPDGFGRTSTRGQDPLVVLGGAIPQVPVQRCHAPSDWPLLSTLFCIGRFMRLQTWIGDHPYL